MWDWRAGERFVQRMHEAVLCADHVVAILSAASPPEPESAPLASLRLALGRPTEQERPLMWTCRGCVRVRCHNARQADRPSASLR